MRTALDVVRDMLRGKRPDRDDLRIIVSEALKGTLPREAVAAFVVSQQFRTPNVDEIADLTLALAETGNRHDFGPETVDKHSIGGVPGNKVSLIIVPIVAAAGLKIPKTSSKSITTVGTAERMEILAPVDLTLEEIIEVVEKTNGCIVWPSGKARIAPADEIFIEVEHMLEINPWSLMIASILAKKIALGVRYLVLDIPVFTPKAPTMQDALRLTNLFMQVCNRLGIRLEVAITYGGQPVGHAIGAALETKEALMVLEGAERPRSLIEKSIELAGILLEMTGRAPYGRGREIALEILRSGKALRKMREIIEAQGGNPNVKSSDIPVAKYKADVTAEADGYVVKVDNVALMKIARAAGVPEDREAGLIIHKKVGRYVRAGEPLLTIYSNNEARLDRALALARELRPVVVEGMVIKRISTAREVSMSAM